MYPFWKIFLQSKMRVWVGGPKPVGRKSENDRVEILPHKDENHKAEKIYSPLLAFYYF